MSPLEIGVIADTHGLLREAAVDALDGVAHVLHAGDVGDPAILERLATIAPVTVVRGNVDRGGHAAAWPETAEVELGGRWFHVLHILDELAIDPAAAGFDVVVFGHSHRPSIERRAGVLFLNPGSAGPRRFRLPISVARVEIDDSGVRARIVELSVDPGSGPATR